MKGITRSEHERKMKNFKKKTNNMKDALLCDMVSTEINMLSTFYDEYQWHIKELQILVEKYNTKTEDLKTLLKKKNCKKVSDSRN